jgi:hypothetical protein
MVLIFSYNAPRHLSRTIILTNSHFPNLACNLEATLVVSSQNLSLAFSLLGKECHLKQSLEEYIMETDK